jgi:hypothetical protein
MVEGYCGLDAEGRAEAAWAAYNTATIIQAGARWMPTSKAPSLSRPAGVSRGKIILHG